MTPISRPDHRPGRYSLRAYRIHLSTAPVHGVSRVPALPVLSRCAPSVLVPLRMHLPLRRPDVQA